KQGAQSIVRTQITRLDDEASRVGAARNERRQLLRRHAPSGDGAHNLATAEHGDGCKFDEDAPWILLKARIVEPNDLTGGRGACKALWQGRRPLAHQTTIAAVKEHGGGHPIERGQECVSLMRLDGDHDRGAMRAPHAWLER